MGKFARVESIVFMACIIAGLSAWVPDCASADVSLPGIFTDHMVLQREKPIPVWGKAAQGEKITVTLAGKTRTVTAGKSGKWLVKLDAMKAGGPYTLKVKGKNTLEVTDVMVGEVWVFGGRSNMAWCLARSTNAKEEIAASKDPGIRFWNAAVEQSSDFKQWFGGCIGNAKRIHKERARGNWKTSKPETAPGFGAIAYFFARKLHKELGVPIGMSQFGYGATSSLAFGADNDWRSSKVAGFVGHDLGGGDAMSKPGAPQAFSPIRGVIWDQVETNINPKTHPRTCPRVYGEQLSLHARNWRSEWKQDDFTFLYMQLPKHGALQKRPIEPSGWAIAQYESLELLSVPNTGITTNIDLGIANDVHPPNKKPFGERLALAALAVAYGKDAVYCGPLYKSMAKQGDKIVISFEHVGGGLVPKDSDKLKGFAIAGKDKKFVWADAIIKDNKVTVSHPKIENPISVRYAWASNPIGNLHNKEGLPASVFRTDDWPYPANGPPISR